MFLSFKRTTSRGRDTYGYNIITLTDERGVKYRCNGGGYDMLGTVTADALVALYGTRLMKLHKKAERFVQVGKSNSRRLLDRSPSDRSKNIYGLTAHYDKNRKKPQSISLDGATGFSNVQAIAKLIKVKVAEVYAGKNLVGVQIIDINS